MITFHRSNHISTLQEAKLTGGSLTKEKSSKDLYDALEVLDVLGFRRRPERSTVMLSFAPESLGSSWCSPSSASSSQAATDSSGGEGDEVGIDEKRVRMEVDTGGGKRQ
ncbi:hypothetical protein ABZP36_004003 [Zizania latifolia]